MTSCNESACKTNNLNSFIYCSKCLLINFPHLNIEDIFEMYIGIVETISILEEEEHEFDILTPEEMKEEAFDLYNRLMLVKQERIDRNE